MALLFELFGTGRADMGHSSLLGESTLGGSESPIGDVLVIWIGSNLAAASAKFELVCVLGNSNTMLTLPAISGADTKSFDTAFWKGITEKRLVDRKTVPWKGSMGVFWHVYKDLRILGPENIGKERVNKLAPRKAEDGKVITAVNAKALRGFYDWCEGPEVLFFIKKGTQPLWLCRKVGGYFYEDKVDDPTWYPHRIAFEFIRSATEGEGIKRLGIGMNTMIWIECEDVPKQIVTESVEMPPRKPGRKPKAKAKATVVDVAPAPIRQETIHPTYVEAEEEPLEVEVIKVQVFELEGTTYYREPIKNKLYKRQGNGSVGAYIGRYSPKDQQVHEEVEDSDQEDGF